MNDGRSVREVLIAELLGEVDGLLSRLDGVAPQIDAANGKLDASTAAMNAAVERYRASVLELTDAAKKHAAVFVARRASEAVAEAVAEQTAALRQAAKGAFEDEALTKARELGRTLEAAIVQVRRSRLSGWLEHAATALVAAGLTAVLFVYLSQAR